MDQRDDYADPDLPPLHDDGEFMPWGTGDGDTFDLGVWPYPPEPEPLPIIVSSAS